MAYPSLEQTRSLGWTRRALGDGIVLTGAPGRGEDANQHQAGKSRKPDYRLLCRGYHVDQGTCALSEFAVNLTARGAVSVLLAEKVPVFTVIR